MKKLIIRGVLGLFGLLVVGVVILYFTINTIAANQIESAATDALGVKTSVGAVRISLFEGRTEILDLDIANPKSYDGEFLTLGDGVLGLNLGSLMSDRVEVKEFTLKDINLSLIQRADGSNVGTIIDNASKGSGDGSDDDSKDDSSDERKFIIDKVEIDNVQVAISVEPLTSSREPTKLTIDQIVVRDIGRKENGVTMDEVTTILVRSILSSAIKAAPEQIPSLMLTTIEGGLSSLTHLDFGGVQIDLGAGLSDLIGGIKGAGETGGKGVEDAVKDIGKGIGGLIDGITGGDKKKSE